MSENIVRKIFKGKFDENVHNDFVKYSKGVFKDKYLLEGKKQGDKWAIKTGPEFVNFLVRRCLDKVSGNVKVKGIIVSTMNLKEEVNLPIQNVKQFMGIKQLVIDSEVPVSDILRAMDKFPKAFFALSFSFSDGELKVKAKAPKSAKPASGGEKEPTADFCSLKTTDKPLVEDLFFEEGDFKEASIRHILEINEIILPKGERDPVKMRENAKRKGIIKRIAKIDGKEIIKETNFEA
jgi:hypothetical protein